MTTQTCRVCNKQFLVIDQEIAFLQAKGLELPTTCPQCRQKRRLTLRNQRGLFKAQCQQCGKDVIVSFDPELTNKRILCKKDYDKYYDENDARIIDSLPDPITAEVFMQELKRIIASHPKWPTQILFSEDCEYGNYVYYCKNLHYCFDCVRDRDSLYLFDSTGCAKCIDCDFCTDSELTYESVDAIKCFNTDYIEFCSGTRDSAYCYNCHNCHDVFGCVGLRNKSFCIFNRQLSESEYRNVIEKYRSLPSNQVLAYVEEIKKTHQLTQTHELFNENTKYGNYMYHNRNCYYLFDTSHNENSGYIFGIPAERNKSSYDITTSTDSELCYEVVDSGYNFNCDYLVFSKSCIDCYYVFDCLNTKNCLGCIRTDNKQYCILNRQFTKEEYERLSRPIIKELKTKNLGWADLIF